MQKLYKMPLLNYVKRIMIITGFIVLSQLITINSLFADSSSVFTVVIDPGHGGKDPGAIGAISYEKNIVLDISLLVGKYLEENLDSIRVIYTRTTDEYPELYRRAEIANENKADLFISIHVNSTANKNSRASGASSRSARHRKSPPHPPDRSARPGFRLRHRRTVRAGQPRGRKPPWEAA